MRLLPARAVPCSAGGADAFASVCRGEQNPACSDHAAHLASRMHPVLWLGPPPGSPPLSGSLLLTGLLLAAGLASRRRAPRGSYGVAPSLPRPAAPSLPGSLVVSLQQQQLQAQHLSHAAHGPPVQLPPHPSGLQPPGIPPVTGSSSGLLALGALGSQAHLAVKDEKNHHDLDHRGESPTPHPSAIWACGVVPKRCRSSPVRGVAASRGAWWVRACWGLSGVWGGGGWLQIAPFCARLGQGMQTTWEVTLVG